MNYQAVLYTFIKGYLERKVPCESTKRAYPTLNDLCFHKNGLNILDVGCGSGELTLKLAETLYEIDSSMKYSILDPAEELLNVCVKGFEVNNLLLNRVLSIPVESFYAEERFDIIFALHSLYGFLEKQEYSINKKTSIVKMIIDLLSPGGIIFFAIAADESHDYQSKRRALKTLGAGKYDLAQSGMLRQILKKIIGDEYIEEYYIDSIVDATEIASGLETPLPEEGRGFLDYSLRVDTRQIDSKQERVIRKHTLRDIILFKYLPEYFKAEMTSMPPDRGPLLPDTPILMHKDYVAIIHKA